MEPPPAGPPVTPEVRLPLPPDLGEGARRAATSSPRRGSLHLSSVPGIPVTLRGDFRREGRDYRGTSHYYWDQTFLVDRDGDGEPDRRMSVVVDSWEGEEASSQRICEIRAVGAFCTANIIDQGPSRSAPWFIGPYKVSDKPPDRYLLQVRRRWYEEGVLGETQELHDVTDGLWYDRETNHTGVFWAGPTVDEPRPLDNPIHGSVRVGTSGYGFLSNGELVRARSWGLLTLDVDESLVKLELGARKYEFSRPGISLTHVEDSGISLSHIEDIWVYEERYDPDSPWFGIGDGQRNDENDVVSGNGRGQFGGVITTWPKAIGGRLVPKAPAVFGVVGLTDIQGHDGLSLLMLYDALFDPQPERY